MLSTRENPTCCCWSFDPGLVGPEIRHEQVPGQDLPYPHIYGPLNVSAVVEARPFGPGPDGQFSFDSEK